MAAPLEVPRDAESIEGVRQRMQTNFLLMHESLQTALRNNRMSNFYAIWSTCVEQAFELGKGRWAPRGMPTFRQRTPQWADRAWQRPSDDDPDCPGQFPMHGPALLAYR
eukprot:2776803-Alexandrium_andersonii.AAC.1